MGKDQVTNGSCLRQSLQMSNVEGSPIPPVLHRQEAREKSPFNIPTKVREGPGLSEDWGLGLTQTLTVNLRGGFLSFEPIGIRRVGDLTRTPTCLFHF